LLLCDGRQDNENFIQVCDEFFLVTTAILVCLIQIWYFG